MCTNLLRFTTFSDVFNVKRAKISKVTFSEKEYMYDNWYLACRQPASSIGDIFSCSHPELRSCVNVEVGVPNTPYSLCERKATLKKMQLCYFVIAVANIDLHTRSSGSWRQILQEKFLGLPSWRTGPLSHLYDTYLTSNSADIFTHFVVLIEFCSCYGFWGLFFVIV